MSRAPFEVLVFLYARTPGANYEYALLRRADAGHWQGVAGGGEEGETPLEAARREAFEEAGIASDSLFLKLDAVESIRVTEFSDSHLWGDQVYVIPQYCFGAEVTDRCLLLSHEHTEYRWLPYDEALSLLTFDGNRTALWELNQRLKGRGPRG